MRKPQKHAVVLLTVVAGLTGCTAPEPASSRRNTSDAVAAYTTRRAAAAAERFAVATSRTATMTYVPGVQSRNDSSAGAGDVGGARFSFASFADEPATQPAADSPARFGERVPTGYWRQDVWHQMGHEGLDFGTRGLWRGFKDAFWDPENAILLTAAMGATVAIRETGVDDTVRNRTHGNRQLGDADEPLQLLGNPATHFAAAGALWLGSTLVQDEESHEVAKALGSALAVNGLTTMTLKAATRTHAPDGDDMAWPSGHTSSSFTVAAVLNEYYGPWVGVPSFALAGLIGYQRLDSRVHDFSDVVFGGVLGYTIGTAIARGEKARFPELWGMKVLPFADPQTGASGIALMKRW